MLRRLVLNGITYHVVVENGAGKCSNGWDMDIFVCTWVEGDEPTLDTKRAEALAEIGRGKRIS